MRPSPATLVLGLLLAGCADSPASEPTTCPERPCAGGETCVAGACKPRGACPDRPCPEGQQCIGGACTLPSCEPRPCPEPPRCDPAFDDGCGTIGSCGCPGDGVCVALACCAPSCTGVDCLGPDGCGGSCTEACGRWVELEPGERPPARDNHAMTTDASGTVLLFGGRRDGSTPSLADLWELTVLAPSTDQVSWRQLHDGTGVTPRDGAELVTAWGRVLLLGGCTGASDCEEVLEWTGADWIVFPTTGDRPAPRERFGLAYDELREQLVLYGGELAGQPVFADPATFTLDRAGTWLEEPDSGQPSGRFELELTWDGNAGGVRLYGGFADGGYDDQHLLWTVGPTGALGWQPIDDHAVPGRSATATAWEPPVLDGSGAVVTPGRLVLFGGFRPVEAGDSCPENKLGDSWQLGPPELRWVPAAESSCTSEPRPRIRHELVAAPQLGGVVLFGGNSGSFGLDDTYLLRRR